MKIHRPLIESEIKLAQDESNSAAEAARKLNVSYNTYKKYAKMYGIMERCKCTDSRGMPKVHNPYRGIITQTYYIYKHEVYSKV